MTKQDTSDSESVENQLPSWLTFEAGFNGKRDGNSLIVHNNDFPEFMMRMRLDESPEKAQFAYTVQFQQFQEELTLYQQKLDYLAYRFGFTITRTDTTCDIVQTDYDVANRLPIHSGDSLDDIFQILAQIETQAKEVDDSRFERLLMLEESGFSVETVEHAGGKEYRISGEGLEESLLIPEHIDAESLKTINALLEGIAIENTPANTSSEETLPPVPMPARPNVPIQQKVSLILDAPIFLELASSRGEGRSWIDLLPIIAASPTVEKIYIPAQVADWELRGQVTHYKPDGSLDVTQIDTEFLDPSHRKNRVFHRCNALLSSADRWQLDDDGVGHLIPGRNHNIVIYQTELDRETMYKAKKIHEDPNLAFPRKLIAYEMLRTDKGEKAMEAIAAELDQECPAYMVTNDFSYLKSRTPITTRSRYPVGEASSMGLFGAFLSTQGTVIKKELEANYGPVPKLNLEQIKQDFLNGGTQRYDTLSYPDWHTPCTPGSYRSHGADRQGETLTEIFARGAALLRNEPVAFTIPAPNNRSTENNILAANDAGKRFVRGAVQTHDKASADNFPKRQGRKKANKIETNPSGISGLPAGNWKLLRRYSSLEAQQVTEESFANSLASALPASPLFSMKEMNSLRKKMNAILGDMTPGDIVYEASQRKLSSIDPLTVSRIVGHAQMHPLDQSTLAACSAPLAKLVKAANPGTHKAEEFSELYIVFSKQLLALKENRKTLDFPELPQDRWYWPSATILKGCTAVSIDTRMEKVERLRDACAELLKNPDRLLNVPADEAHSKPAGEYPVKELLGKYKAPPGGHQPLEGFFYFFDPRIKEHLREAMGLPTWLPENRKHWPSATMKGCSEIGVERSRANADAIERICQRLLSNPANAWELGKGVTDEEVAGVIPVSDLIKFHSHRGQAAASYFDPRLLEAGVITKAMIGEERRAYLNNKQKETLREPGNWSKFEFAKLIHIEYGDKKYQKLWESISAAYYANDDHNVVIDGHKVHCSEKTNYNGRQMLFLNRSEAEWVKFKLGLESAYDPQTDQTKWQDAVQKKGNEIDAERKSILPDSQHIQNRSGKNRRKP